MVQEFWLPLDLLSNAQLTSDHTMAFKLPPSDPPILSFPIVHSEYCVPHIKTLLADQLSWLCLSVCVCVNFCLSWISYFKAQSNLQVSFKLNFHNTYNNFQKRMSHDYLYITQ